jgi:hypothetical protein
VSSPSAPIAPWLTSGVPPRVATLRTEGQLAAYERYFQPDSMKDDFFVAHCRAFSLRARPQHLPQWTASFAPASFTTAILPSVTISSPVELFSFFGAAGRSTSAYATPVPMNNRSVSTHSRSRST